MEEVEQDIFEYIELFYNRQHIHSTLGKLSSVKYYDEKIVKIVDFISILVAKMCPIFNSAQAT